jgi:membrane protease YdiL (CAAX protease family)
MTTEAPARGAGFWDRAATWKAVLLIVGYLVFYLLVGQLVGAVFGGEIDDDNVLADAPSTFFAVVLPIAIGGLALLVFAWRLGWVGALFARQSVAGRRWMWIAPVIVGVAVVAHVGATDWGAWTSAQLLVMVLVGAAVGFTEEIATRGLAVKILRDAGHRERYVAVVSSLLFALMHLSNLITGMKLSTVLATVVYTFAFGMCMYLSMRVTGTLWAAIILHGLTDPTTFLATGGIDESVSGGEGGWTTVALLATLVLIVFGIVAAFLVRGRARAAA